MPNEADDSSSKLVEQGAPSAQFPPLQRNFDQLEALSEKLQSKTLRTEAPSQSIAATRLLAREGLNDEQLARDLKSFELKAALGGAVGKIQRIHAFLRSIEIQKRVGAFSAALVTINKCLFAAIGALSRGRLDGESRTAGLIHSGNELVESFKCYPEVRKDTCKACWKDEMGMAEIVSSKGRLLTTIGIVRDGKIYFSIEETLYMAEVGALHLLHDDICLSLEEIYKMVSQGRYGCCWESFEVYKHLKSLGYIVSRHGVPWTLSHLTKNDSILNEATTKTNLKRDSEYEDTSITIKLFKSMHIDKVKPVFDVYAPNSKFRKSSPGNPNFVCLTSSLPPSKQEISDLERRCSGIPLKLCNVEHGRVTVFSFNTVELPILP